MYDFINKLLLWVCAYVCVRVCVDGRIERDRLNILGGIPDVLTDKSQ